MKKMSPLKGSGMFSIANCMNHNCVPNIMSSSSQNDHKINFVGISPILQGEELTISYIDENLPYQERQKLLNKFYSFSCICIKCKHEKEKNNEPKNIF